MLLSKIGVITRLKECIFGNVYMFVINRSYATYLQTVTQSSPDNGPKGISR